MKYSVLIMLILLCGCSLAIDGAQYKTLQPVFSPETFFDGQVKAWGIVQNRSGNMVQQFTVNINGHVNKNTLILDETFHYLLGEGVAKRTWEIDLLGDATYQGKATDIEGPAQGQVFGNAMRWQYHMSLPVDGTNYNVTFEDWLWAFDENRLINRSYIKKFGLVMAEVTIYMEKVTPNPQ